jgi:hypothetical protein
MTKKLCSASCLCLALAAIFFSCAGTPRESETAPNLPAVEEPSLQSLPQSPPPSSPIIESPIPITEETPPEQETQTSEALPAQEAPQLAESSPENAIPEEITFGMVPQYFVWKKELAPEEVPEKPEIPAVPEFIMGDGILSPETMSAFLLAANPLVEKEFVEDLAFFYIEESAVEGINHDTAFAQMCLETGFLSFTGLVSPEQNNFCGLGATGPGQPGERFPDPRTGVRAHIQHLKAYATDIPLKQDLVDPRYYYVRFGSSPAIRGLSGTWATDELYADKIANILERLYNFAYGI